MATIGSFKKSDNGDYAGAVKTLTLNVKARITPVEKTNDKAPDFRIYAGKTEFGAAWKKGCISVSLPMVISSGSGESGERIMR